MSEIVRAIIVSDKSSISSLTSSLVSVGVELSAVVVGSGSELEQQLSAGHWDFVLLDYRLQAARAFDIPAYFHNHAVRLPVLVALDRMDTEGGARALRDGATAVVNGDDLDQLTLSVLAMVLERRRLDERVREQAALLDQTKDAIFICDLVGRITYWNRGAERLYGFGAARAIGASADSLCVPDEAEEFAEARKIAVLRGEWIGQLSQIGDDHRPLTVVCRCTPILGNDGKPKSILVVTTDISEIKEHEEQFIRSQRLESIGTLAGGIAHDLNNVLAPIIMASFLLKSKIDRDDVRNLVDTIEGSALRGSEIVKQVLTFAKDIEGEHNLIQLKHILRDVGTMVKETFPKHIKVESDIPKDLPTVRGDATQLQQMLLNLCVNARDAVAEKGDHILISAARIHLDESFSRSNVDCTGPGSYLMMRVKDNGCGIAPDVLPRVFDPFFTTKKGEQGTGMGLSTALAIAKGHGGFIRVESMFRQGSEFSVYIPAQEEEEEEKRVALDERHLLGHGELILVIDDEEAIREVTSETLSANGYNVICAENGAVGVAEFALKKDEIRVVITDTLMPVMDGAATIAALRKIVPDIPIIATSGFAGDHKAEIVKQLANAFLPRPFTATQMLEQLRQALIKRDRATP